MRYIPRLACIIPGLSISSVYTWGIVIKGPPSLGQFTIWGKSLIRHCPKLTGALLLVFRGRAERPISAILAYLRGCRIARIGSDFRSTIVLILSSVSLKIKRERSIVPKRFDRAGNLL